MTDTSPPFDFSRLSVAERILLAQQLWESIGPNADTLPLPETQKQELERRWAAFEAGDMLASPWPEVKQALLRR